MSRRGKGPSIAVEVAPEQIDPARIEDAELDARWLRAGRRLRAVDPNRYRRIFALAEAFASLDDEPESELMVRARLALIDGASREVN